MDTRKSLLFDAIESATQARLRNVFRDICNDCPEAFKSACERLLTDNGDTCGIERCEDESHSDSESELAQDEEEENSPAPPSKRKLDQMRQRFEVCCQCDNEYDVLENSKGVCIWDEGELEVDYDADIWADHDESCHGTIDSEDMREEHPEGFTWNCCDRTGDRSGCKKGVHRPKSNKRTRNGY